MLTNVLLFWTAFVIVSATCAAALIAVILVMDYIAHPPTEVIDGH